MKKVGLGLVAAWAFLMMGGCSMLVSEDNTAESKPSIAQTKKKGSKKATTYAIRNDNVVSETQFYNTFAQTKQTYLFPINKSKVEPAYDQELNALSQYLVSHPTQKVHLDGFTCELGSSEYNVALGERRAQSLANYLVEHGVRKDQIEIVSYGKEKPVDTHHNEEAWRQNRRVEAYF
jgi:peptidoglycan-associated lipoprotein